MTSSTGDRIIAQLRDAKAKYPELTDILDLHADLFAAGTQASANAVVPEISAEEARARCTAGVPLLRPQDISLDWASLWRSFEQVCASAARRRPDLADQFNGLLALAQAAPEQVKARMLQYLELGGFDALEEDLTQQEELLAFVFNHTLRPLLRTCATQLAPLLRQELWQRDDCPICGGEPDFAILDDKAGTRYLICSRCDTPWLYPRVKCPFCNTSNPADLTYYPSEDGKYRLYTCGACRRYLKTMDLRHVGASAPPAEVARILTVDLDITAREEGYC